MKKVWFLLAALVLCLALTACGGMAGEKAAALYPDIIGRWGTDPFGEEFVLTLEKDGTCTILDNAGTWTLEEKQSNEEWVILNVKTQSLKYYVRLNRIQNKRQGAFHTVRLLIQDAKQETTLYEDYVFTPEGNFVDHELAVQTVPELIGEWGSPYWNEESFLTVREDGTCTLMRQPGKWCLRVDFSTWHKVLMLVKLENGVQYEVELSMDPTTDWGYDRGWIFIYDRKTETPVWIDDEAQNPDGEVVNRSKIVNTLDIASVAVGDWLEEGKEEPFATFREDGTCTIRKADGVWSLDYIAYYNEDFRNGWDYCLHAKIKGDEYDICFSDRDSGQYHMYIINQTDGIYIVDPCDVMKVTAE